MRTEDGYVRVRPRQKGSLEGEAYANPRRKKCQPGRSHMEHRRQ